VVRLLFALLVISAVVLGATISYYNWSPVTFSYVAGEFQLPLIALLLAAFVLGVLVMWLLSLARLFLLSRESRRQQRQIRELEAELKNLRNLPLEGGAGAAAAPPASTRNA
jgi:uncharacterized integral membrane protein